MQAQYPIEVQDACTILCQIRTKTYFGKFEITNLVWRPLLQNQLMGLTMKMSLSEFTR